MTPLPMSNPIIAMLKRLLPGRPTEDPKDPFVTVVTELAERTHQSKAEVLRNAVNLYWRACSLGEQDMLLLRSLIEDCEKKQGIDWSTNPPLTMTETWITHRPPSQEDADEDGEVLVPLRPDLPDDPSNNRYIPWSYVGEATPWKHCYGQQPPTSAVDDTPTPTTTPRRFKETPRRTIAPNGCFIDAIDEDGVAWWMAIATRDPKPEWCRMLPLPAREVEK